MMGSMASDPPSLGTRIRRARERLRMSQRQLAARIGVSVRAVGDWENDRSVPRNSLGALEELMGSLDGIADGDSPEALAEAVRNARSLTERQKRTLLRLLAAGDQ